VDELADGEARIVAFPEGRAPYRSIIVARVGDEHRAWWNVCRHLPVPLDGGTLVAPLEERELVCTTHGARFELDAGLCTSGPCEGEALETIELRREAGQIVADVLVSGGKWE